MTPASHAPILLYDGSCGLCDRSVRYLLARDRQRLLRFAPLDGATARGILRDRDALAAADSVIWYEPGEGESAPLFLVRSRAAIRALRYLGWPYSLAALLLIVPRPLRDAVYDLVAAHRHRLLSPDTACVLPPPEDTSRFLP